MKVAGWQICDKYDLRLKKIRLLHPNLHIIKLDERTYAFPTVFEIEG